MSKSVGRPPRRTVAMPNRVTVRFTDDELEKLVRYQERHGLETNAAAIRRLLRRCKA